MSIRAKIVGCFLVILVFFTGVSIYSYSRFRQSNARLANVNDLFLPISRIVVQLQGNVFSAAEEMHRFYFLPDGGTSQNTSIARLVRDLYPYHVNKKLSTMEEMLSQHTGGELKEMAAELTALIQKFRESFPRFTSSTTRPQFDAAYQDLRQQLHKISSAVDDECQRITAAAQSEGREALISCLVLSTIAGISGLLTILLSSRMLKPLPVLIDSIRKIAEGDFNQSLKVSTSDKDEVSLLAREYNKMLAGLNDRDKQILKQQTELLQSERLAAIGQLSAEVVHEIRNPLNSISLNIDWLEHELKGVAPEVEKTLRSISREIERLHQITESYLVRSRIPLKEPQRTEVNDLIREILDFSKEEDRAKNIKVETALAAQEIFVTTDRSRLKQAFLNVLRNAREAMPRGGKLCVRTEIKDNVSRVLFTDSGYGMNDATRRQTFQPFYTTKPNGNGLGLVLTKEIVEEANGSIQCDSQIGEGTTFTFQFPV